ncbi:hypothetical protein KFU94_39585 [Chloroflexi bacterium TSY]|nr:hypothetical protein [Chloroflexi bacterium TSY]
MKRINSFTLLSLLLTAALLLTACPAATPDSAGSAADSDAAELVCDDAIGCVEYGPDEPIKVASALVITGPNESLGLDSQYDVEIAILDRGEIHGHTIELQAEDDGCSAEGGQTAGQKIVSDLIFAQRERDSIRSCN